MALNTDTVNKQTPEFEHTYTWQDAVSYGLGIGAKADELGFLYEQRGPRVFPTYGVIPAYDVNRLLFEQLGGDMLGLVHGGQKVFLHKSFPSEGTVRTTGQVTGVYDLKRMAIATTRTETKDIEGNLLCETEWSLIFRNDGGFGGAPPPREKPIRPPERDPDFKVEDTSTDEQALLYRLSGDHNPLHADPAIGKQAGFGKPILHGLCTFGYMGRAVLKACCDNDPNKIKALIGNFRKPVFPGDTLITEGWKEDQRILLRVSAKQRPNEYVVTGAYAELS